MTDFDGLVVGGGPAGSAFAITLAAAGRSVALLDRSRAGRRPGEILSPDVRPELAALGVWEQFRDAGHLASSGTVSVWGSDEPVAHDFISSPFGDSWHVDRTRFDEMLRECAERAGARVDRFSRVTSATFDRQGWRVDATTAGGVRLSFRADYLIEATGRARSITGVPIERIAPDRMIGMVATVDARDARGDEIGARMLLEATESGWWYSAPFSDSRMVVALMTDPDVRGSTAGLREDVWRLQLGRSSQTAARVGEASVLTLSVVSASSYLRRRSHERWLPIGDAAAAYDPLSGQGVVRALRSGRIAALAVMAAQAGAADALRKHTEGVARDFHDYLRRRYEHYGTERRWPESPFWQRRHADAPAPNYMPKSKVSK